MRSLLAHVLTIFLFPILYIIEHIRGKSNNTLATPTKLQNRVKLEEDSKNRVHQILRFFLPHEAFQSRTTVQDRRLTENPGDAAAKAIADSLVTQVASSSSEQTSRRRSVRISQLQNEESHVPTIKSPTSAALSPEIVKRAKLRASSLSKPLIPQRPTKKTLILDLDETLIHSLSNGGKVSDGHMVEVKLGTHAILYYVYKRPHCDTFLERVSEWYDVVIFTASVQEYADPVIDWLEQDRSFFKARYYRQHCTYRYGAYMKDLSIAQPDLSRAIIVDNSPLSYRMNEENAIPIEGWISDPSDRDLLHLIPVLQNLHLVGDVRSLLSLRQPD